MSGQALSRWQIATPSNHLDERPVALERCVAGEQGEVILDGLRHQQPVKRIAVNPRQHRHPGELGCRDALVCVVRQVAKDKT